MTKLIKNVIGGAISTKIFNKIMFLINDTSLRCVGLGELAQIVAIWPIGLIWLISHTQTDA